ncbi:hypothetical protein LIA77_07280 [Sarocladium implicatum]|nr:hypothetical protein LIA77_07280 [Sarocladium implicatum]
MARLVCIYGRTYPSTHLIWPLEPCPCWRQKPQPHSSRGMRRDIPRVHPCAVGVHLRQLKRGSLFRVDGDAMERAPSQPSRGSGEAEMPGTSHRSDLLSIGR